MDDFRILENLFEKHNAQIHFDLFKESNIISHNNNNQGNFNKEINFNTQSLASQIIYYKDACILLEIQVTVPYENGDQGKKTVPPLLYIKKSYELVNYLKISLINIFYIFIKHSVSSGVFYEGANFMISGLPEISISFFSELASIIYSLGFHNLFCKYYQHFGNKIIPVAVMHWRVCYIMGAD